MANQLLFSVQGTEEIHEFEVKKVFNAGYAGSDQENVQNHIAELAELGVPAPKTTPTLYPVSNYLAVQFHTIQVQHSETSGEVEYVLFWWDGKLYVTVGSDHTDRKLESFSVPMAKQATPNIVAKEAWRFEDIKDHWEKIELECWSVIGGHKELYQQGTFGDLMMPGDWNETFTRLEINQNGHLFYSGTVKIVSSHAAFAENYEILMRDPVLDRTIKHAYTVEQLAEAIE